MTLDDLRAYAIARTGEADDQQLQAVLASADENHDGVCVGVDTRERRAAHSLCTWRVCTILKPIRRGVAHGVHAAGD